MDHYARLGVSRQATKAEIKKAYRSLARQLHPDITGSQDDHEIKALNEAYATLVDPEKRAHYDSWLRTHFFTARVKSRRGQPVTFLDFFFALIERILTAD